MTQWQVILITLIAYKVVLVTLGIWGQRRTRDSVDFFLGGRKLGPCVAAVSASASSSSAWTLLGVSGAAYTTGLSAVWLFPACVGGFCLNWYVLAPALRRVSHRTGALTLTEVLTGPRGRPLRTALTVCASLIILLSLGSYVASQFQAAGKTFNETFHISMESSILIGGAVILVYTLLGGFWAVSLTDTLQGLMMAAAAVVLPVVALVEVGGPGGLIEGFRAPALQDHLSLWKGLPLFGAVGFVLGTFGIGLGYPGQPHVVNRFMALKEGDHELRRARRIAILWAVIIYSGMIVLGLCGRVLIEKLGDDERILIKLSLELFSPVLAGFILAAVLSAMMSTADSQLLVAASSVTHDLGLGRKSSGSLIGISRVVVVLLTLGSAVAALYVRETIFDWVLFAWSAMGCAFGPLLLVTVLKGPVPPGRSLVSMGLGFSLSVLAYLGPHVGLATQGGVFDRVLPFVVALGVAVIPLPGASPRTPRP